MRRLPPRGRRDGLLAGIARRRGDRSKAETRAAPRGSRPAHVHFRNDPETGEGLGFFLLPSYFLLGRHWRLVPADGDAGFDFGDRAID